MAVLFCGNLLIKKRRDVAGHASHTSPLYWLDRATDRHLFNPVTRIWYRGVESRKEVALTIDDGPHPVSCPKMLEVLRRKKVLATFFVVGKQVEGNPDLVRELLRDGHEIANHTYNHFRLNTLSRQQIYDEIVQCDEAIQRVVGRNTKLFRPPGMRSNQDVLNVVGELDKLFCHWTIGAKDFVGTIPDYEMTPELKKLPITTPARIVEYVEKQLHPGGIILLHDNPVTAEALESLIDMIHKNGYEIRSCKDMMRELPQRIMINPNPVCGQSELDRLQ